MHTDSEEDFLKIIEDDDHDCQEWSHFWNILVVDDDDEVHQATKFALNNTQILDKKLRLFHAYSAREAEDILSRENDIAVIFLDVVMENNDSGLDLVGIIRDQLDLKEVRIILRTGQPGYAPETEVINDYDINDYRSKGELTQTRLLTSLTAAIRSYQQILAISNGRKGLNQIIEATSDLLTRNGLHNFASGIITQLSSFFSLSLDGLIAVRLDKVNHTEQINIIAAGHQYEDLVDHPISDLQDERIRSLVTKALDTKESQVKGHEAVLYFAGKEQPIAAYVTSEQLIPECEQSLLHLFCQNIAMCSDNLTLISHLNDHAYKDMTTGLANRNRFVENLQAILNSERKNYLLLVLNIDHFNSIVETVGAKRSQEMLQSFANRLNGSYDDERISVARIGGDVFGLLGPEDMVAPEKVQPIFETPLPIGDMSLPVSVSMGVAPLAQAEDYVTAISAAYTALKKAKDHHRGSFFVYNESMTRNMTQRINILSCLRDALKSDEFYLVYQPQVDLQSGKVIGLETLIRWVNEKGEFIAPAVFIPIAENSGMILSIGKWVFENSCKHLRALHDAGHGDITISINVSAAQLKDPGFHEFVVRTLAEYHLPANKVDIEITETLAMEDIDYCISIIDGFKQAGLHVSLDDFGTGYSSLAYLQRLNIDRLKVDRSFVIQIGQSEASERIILSIIKLAQQLDLDVLAEGIENEQQQAFLCETSCNLAQGYLFSKPMKYNDLLDWLSK